MILLRPVSAFVFSFTACFRPTRVQSGNNEGEIYMYKSKAAYPVEEYELDMNERAQAGALARPSFVLDVSWPRVVQFYLPSSGVCQEFKQNFVDTAREIRRRSAWAPVDFFAVSCAAHHSTCMDFEVTGVPHLIAFRAGNSEGQILARTKDNKLDADHVSDILGIFLHDEHDSAPIHHHADAGNEKVAESKKVDSAGKQGMDDVYDDAVLSFIFALKSSIYVETAPGIYVQSEALSEERTDLLHEWIDLLHWSLPSQWAVHNLINDIRNNMSQAIASRLGLDEIIDRHTPAVKRWSTGCSHGRDGDGYTCGLWKLFHVMTLGVAEQHSRVLGDKERVSPYYAVDTLREYVTLFFGCPVCQESFLSAFDPCRFKQCSRWQAKKSSQATWRDLSLWLWEYHNSVNVEVLREEASRMRLDVTTENEEAALWPAKDMCPRCRRRNGQWDEDKVYDFLKEEYWPDSQNARFVVLDRVKRKSKNERADNSSFLVRSLQLFAPFMLTILWLALKRLNVSKTGWHKKVDDSINVACFPDDDWDFVVEKSDPITSNHDSANIYVIS